MLYAFYEVEKEILDASRPAKRAAAAARAKAASAPSLANAGGSTGGSAPKDGTTATVALRMGNVLYVAHVGDSRAVLCRKGKAVQLTDDHKPNHSAERERIHKMGGRVYYAGCWRVLTGGDGNGPVVGLAVSRSLGDIDFKEPVPLVTANPDLSKTVLQPHDSFVVVASDGLWDVLSNQEACDMVARTVKARIGQTKGQVTEQVLREASPLAPHTCLALYASRADPRVPSGRWRTRPRSSSSRRPWSGARWTT